MLSPDLSARTIYAGPENYITLLRRLLPGDTLRLAPGYYRNGMTVRLKGEPGRPIIIKGAESGPPTVILGRSCCNTIQINDASHLEFHHMTLDAKGVGGVQGVDSRGSTHHITLSHLNIINHGSRQGQVGISTKGPAWNWLISHNTIVGAGTGMYLGNSDGNHPFVAGVIEHNLIVDTIGYNLQIKHQNPRPVGIGLPQQASRTIIRHNVFSKQNNGSSGGRARPNVLIGHLPLSGPGLDDIYEIYGNFFYENPHESLFQGEGNIALYSNLFVNSVGSAVNVRPHNDIPRNIHVFQNTVLASSRGIRITGGAEQFTQSVAANAVFAQIPIRAAGENSNFVVGFGKAEDILGNPFASPGELDLYPLAGKLGVTDLDMRPYTVFTDSHLDFNSTPRAGTHYGAYAGDGSNPGWRPRLEIKPLK
jgi:hypothetical protein